MGFVEDLKRELREREIKNIIERIEKGDINENQERIHRKEGSGR